MVVIAWLFLAWSLAAQATAPPKPIETNHLTVVLSRGAIAEEKLSLYVDVTPKPKMHVYAPGQDGYIGISLKLDAQPAIAAGKATYPPGERLFMPALKETQRVYAKPFRITQEVTLGADAPVTLTVRGTLRYQACDDTICYLPVTVPVSWTVSR